MFIFCSDNTLISISKVILFFCRFEVVVCKKLDHKLSVCMFYLTVHHFLARVQSPTFSTYGKSLLKSIMAMLTLKSRITTELPQISERSSFYNNEFILRKILKHIIILSSISDIAASLVFALTKFRSSLDKISRLRLSLKNDSKFTR